MSISERDFNLLKEFMPVSFIKTDNDNSFSEEVDQLMDSFVLKEADRKLLKDYIKN